jgi:dienelactone hydrolase
VRLLAAVRKRLTRSARLIACALLTTSALAAGQAFTIHELRNARVDPAASDPGRVSYAGFDPTASPRDAVLVLLGGTGSAPSGYKLFAEEALRQGFHVIVLDYSDATSVGSLCRDDLACYGRVRQELIEGVDTSPVVRVSKDDAIFGRLGHALRYLSTEFPAEGWNAYLRAGRIDWSHVLMAGFSQGAGHALWIAKHDPLRGVILFSGPVDGRIQPPYQPARWITADGRWATAQSRMKLFVSTRDGYYPAIRANLVALGFDPSTSGVNVDDGLATSRAGALFLTHVPSPRAHASVIEDAATPRAPNGTARYAPVWDALLAGY